MGVAERSKKLGNHAITPDSWRKDKALADAAALLSPQASAMQNASITIQADWGRGRGGLISPEDRRKAMEILDAAMAAGAGVCKLAEPLVWG